MTLDTLCLTFWSMLCTFAILCSPRRLTTALFVLLWGSAAIFTRWGLDNASPMALLVFRFLVALVALAPLAIVRRRWLPAPGTRLADSGHRSDADWRLFGLLLRGDGQRRDAGTYRHHHGDPAHPYALRGGAPPAGAAAVRAAACPGGAGAAGVAQPGGLADGDGGDPVCAGGAAADDLWRAVAKAQPSGAGGCPAAAVCR